MKNFVFLSLISFIQRRTLIFLLRDNSLNLAEKETPKFKVPNPNCEILLGLYRNPRLDRQVEPADGMTHFHCVKKRMGAFVLPSCSFWCLHPSLLTSFPTKTVTAKGCWDGSICANFAQAWKTEFSPWNPQWKERIDDFLNQYPCVNLHTHTHTTITYTWDVILYYVGRDGLFYPLYFNFYQPSIRAAVFISSWPLSISGHTMHTQHLTFALF